MPGWPHVSSKSILSQQTRYSTVTSEAAFTRSRGHLNTSDAGALEDKRNDTISYTIIEERASEANDVPNNFSQGDSSVSKIEQVHVTIDLKKSTKNDVGWKYNKIKNESDDNIRRKRKLKNDNRNKNELTSLREDEGGKNATRPPFHSSNPALHSTQPLVNSKHGSFLIRPVFSSSSQASHGQGKAQNKRTDTKTKVSGCIFLLSFFVWSICSNIIILHFNIISKGKEPYLFFNNKTVALTFQRIKRRPFHSDLSLNFSFFTQVINLFPSCFMLQKLLEQTYIDIICKLNHGRI